MVDKRWSSYIRRDMEAHAAVLPTARRRQTAERLRETVRVLEELPPGKRFDLGTWAKCGTVGCAVGWAAQDPWHRRRGLTLVLDYGLDPGDVKRYAPQYRGEDGWCAVEEYYGMGHTHVLYLFHSDHYHNRRRNRAAVCARIRAAAAIYDPATGPARGAQ